MEIITDLKKFDKRKFPNLVVALGNFDGVHLGHQEILKTIKERANRLNGVSGVFTFKEHPQRVLHQKEDPPILTSLIHKLFLLEQAAVDICFLVDFTLELSRKNPEDFVREIFVEALGAKEICLGFNARFGHDRSGDSRLMRELGQKYHFEFLEAGPLKQKGAVVSSSAIRSFVREGRLEDVQAFLGRPYSFFGTVVSGSGRGSGLGFPTANLDPHSEVMPPEGVYAAWVRILDCQLQEARRGCLKLEKRIVGDHLRSLLNYGRRPTFEKGTHPIPEIHILDYTKDLVDKTVEVVVGKWLRPEKSFPSKEALKHQIEADIQAGQKWFATQSF